MTGFTLYALTHEGSCKKGQIASKTIVQSTERVSCQDDEAQIGGIPFFPGSLSGKQATQNPSDPAAVGTERPGNGKKGI